MTTPITTLSVLAKHVALYGIFISATAVSAPLDQHRDKRWTPVSGTATHYFPTAILHTSEPTGEGKTERSTDTIDLNGDIRGRIVYHVTSEFNFIEGTLINTGYQVFSGTVLEGDPVMILDDNFMFRVDLHTGDTHGDVFLNRPLAGKRTQCRLKVTGTGFDADGNGVAEYQGLCRVYGKHNKR
ncbi:hypothetical protein [Alteromonas sp. H39]|uniref:hypothetical protein n=1 Tax=Alteromonas sp. H39 TaxID=3389876 RepID=UPI0039DFF23F